MDRDAAPSYSFTCLHCEAPMRATRLARDDRVAGATLTARCPVCGRFHLVHRTERAVCVTTLSDPAGVAP